MTWRCTHCDEIYDDDQVCVSFEEGRKYEQDQRIEALEVEVERLERLRAFDTGSATLPPGVVLEHARLDGMWQQLVRERDEARQLVREMLPWWPGDQVFRLPEWAKKWR